MDNISKIYTNKDGRIRAYISETKQVVSYPRIIMENIIGRKLLPNEEVHHKDGNALNNDIDNLEVLTKKEHLKIHSEENRKYYDKTMVCPVCGKEFLWTSKQQIYFYGNTKRRNKKYGTIKSPFCSKRCAGKYGRELQRQNGINPAKRKNN